MSSETPEPRKHRKQRGDHKQHDEADAEQATPRSC
jgi:hypothetical protein